VQKVKRTQDATAGRLRASAIATDAQVADAFFAGNAVRCLGLNKRSQTRLRLESFYERRKIEQPDWLRRTKSTKLLHDDFCIAI
jgi:hypothetical protein